MARIENVFVLMLENRSFDHMLGFSGLTGTDAVTGQPTKIEGVPAGAADVWSCAKIKLKSEIPGQGG
jgi:phospholipase C